MAVTQFIHSDLATTITTYLDTGLNELADDGVVLGAAIDNSGNRLMMIDVEIYLATVDLTATANEGVQIRMVQSLDETNYEDDGVTAYGITLPIESTSAAHRRIGTMYAPAGFFKLSVVNKTGAAFGATTNTLKYALYTPETDI